MAENYQLELQIIAGILFGTFCWRVGRFSASALAFWLFITFVFTSGLNLVASSIVRGEIRGEADDIFILRSAFLIPAVLTLWALRRYGPEPKDDDLI